MAITSLVAFWLVSILFVITPGADWAYAIAAGLRERAIFPSVTGLLSGHIVATLLVAAGVGAVIAAIPVALMFITTGGSLYLLWLGTELLRHPPLPAAAGTERASSWQLIIKGFAVSGLNPKVFLLFLALLPQFADPTSAWPPAFQMIALGMVHVVSCGIIYFLVALSSKSLLRERPGLARVVGQVSGALMIGIAATLIGEQIFFH